MNRTLLILPVALLCVFQLFSLRPAVAADVPVPSPPTLDARSYILIDHDSGRVLAQHNADQRMEPASIVKLMTAYAVFDALRSGKLKLDDQVVVSEHAWRTGGARTDGSTSFLEINSQVPVEVLLQGMIVQSGNDATIALAERVGGSEPTFVSLMNNYAKQIGLINSNFENSTGLPTPNAYMSARDIVKLSSALIREFPQYYRWYSQKDFTWNKHKQQNRNGLLWRDSSVDGVKTGHTESAGYCLATSAKRDGMRLVATVLGTKSFRAREDSNHALLNYGFSFFETRKLYEAGKPLGHVRVWKADAERTPIGLRSNVHITLPRGRFENVKPEFVVTPNLTAPLAANQKVGELRLKLGNETVATRALYPLRDEPIGGLWTRAVDSMRLWME